MIINYLTLSSLITTLATSQAGIMEPWKKHKILAGNDSAAGQASRVLAGTANRNIVWYENALK